MNILSCRNGVVNLLRSVSTHYICIDYGHAFSFSLKLSIRWTRNKRHGSQMELTVQTEPLISNQKENAATVVYTSYYGFTNSQRPFWSYPRSRCCTIVPAHRHVYKQLFNVNMQTMKAHTRDSRLPQSHFCV